MLPEIDGKKKCIEVPKQYVFATETTDWIIKGEKYEVAEIKTESL